MGVLLSGMAGELGTGLWLESQGTAPQISVSVIFLLLIKKEKISVSQMCKNVETPGLDSYW